MALTVLGAALRFATLDGQGFWSDEAVSVGLVDMSFDSMLETIPDSESTPPLYYVLAWLWTQLFGTGEVGLRSLSALCGSAVVPIAWATGRQLSTRTAAVALAALAATSPFLVWYSQEARSYALLTMIGALSLWLLARLMNAPSRRDLMLWTLAAGLALATHYFALFLIAGEALWLLARHRPRREAVVAVGVVGLVAVALLPLARSQEASGYAAFIAEDSLPRRVALAAKELALGFDSPVEVVSAGVVVLLFAAGVALALARPDPDDRVRQGVRVAAGLGLFSVAAPLALALAGTDYVLSRNLVLAWLPLTLVAATGLTGRAAGGAGRVAVAFVVVLALATTVWVAIEPAWQREDWRGAAQRLGPPANRAILVSEPNHARAVALYRPRARRADRVPHRLSEVAVLARRGRNLDDYVPTAPPPEALAALGLRVAANVREPTYELLRLTPTSGASVTLTADQLQSVRLAGERGPAAVLLER